jgi:hypothetical protein
MVIQIFAVKTKIVYYQGQEDRLVQFLELPMMASSFVELVLFKIHFIIQVTPAKHVIILRNELKFA